jgi:hypothetical protein
MTDRNVEAVRNKLAERAAAGLRKYGTTTERNDLTPLQWFQHLQDELMDAAVYCEVLMRTLAVKPSPPTPPDHGPKMRQSTGGYYIVRQKEGKLESFAGGTWTATRPSDEWSTKADALRALAKATGYEIKAVPTPAGKWFVKSNVYLLDTVNGQWSNSTIGVEHAAAKLIAEALEARGHYPDPMCDRGEVGNG